MIEMRKLSLLFIVPYVFCQHIVEQNGINTSITYKNIENSSKLMSEGGVILLNDSISNHMSSPLNALSLPKVSETGKKTSSVVRKNGVKFTSEELAALNSTSDLQLQDKTPHPRTNQYSKTGNETSVNVEKNKIVSPVAAQTTTKKLIVHKPLILSSEALAKADKNAQLSSLPIVKSSSKTIADQVPPPVDNNSLSSKLYYNTGKHPGMIMPIVITIFVVPMFVVLGYMALKRGQEAWRNRHYKRMDFLLDGMYND